MVYLAHPCELLALVALGVIWTCVTLMRLAIGWLFYASWLALQRLLTCFCGVPLSSAGSAHFARKRELDAAGVWREKGLPLGLWDGRTVREPRDGHVAVFGPPRSRKSWGLIMPAIETYPGSVVVTDLRGELHERTSAARERRGLVFRFDPAGRDSCHLNILDMVRWGEDEEYGDVHRLCHHILHPLGEDKAGPFAQPGVPLLIALVSHCRLQGAGHLPGVVAFLTAPERTMDAKLKDMLSSPHPLVQAGARRTLDQSERLRSAVWNAVSAPLAVFADPLIASHTERSDVTLDQLMHDTAPVSLYLCMKFSDIGRLGVLFGAFVETLVAWLGPPAPPP